MAKSYEFVDRVYEDGPLVKQYKLGERLVGDVVKLRDGLASDGEAVQIEAIQRRFHMYGIDPAAVMIALREAHSENRLTLDEIDGIVYPASPRRSDQDRYRYM